MSGRDYIPGEGDPYLGTRDHARYLSRICSGQIADVTANVGKIKVITLKEQGSHPVTIPPLWFSAKSTNPNDEDAPAKTAWGRYMPLGSEYVEIGFRNDDTPYVLGYNCTATGNRDRAGYDYFKTLQEDGVVGFAGFRQLKPGEFDFKSVGDAYIHGSAFGTMFIAGGQAFIRLDKQKYRIESKSAELHFTSDTSQFRLGTVFRKLLPTDPDENAVPKGGSSYKEILIDLNESISGIAAPQSKFKLHAGDILLPEPTNTPDINPSTGAPYRVRMEAGDAANALAAFTLEIDALGNIDWDQNVAVNPAANLNMAIGNTTINVASTDGTFHIGWTGPQVSAMIAERFETLYNALIGWLDAHTHSTGVGPSGPPIPPLASTPGQAPWDPLIISTKLKFPDL